MLIELNMFFYICCIESAPVYLRSRYEFMNPSGDCRARMIRMGFSFSRGSEVPKEPGSGQTWNPHSLDQVNGVLDNRKPHRQFVFRGGSFSFFPFQFLRLVSFPFLSFKINLLIP
jgi:hypothetical protein